MYEALVCVIGHDVMLHKMRFWHIRAATRGNGKDKRHLYEAARITAFVTAKSMGASEEIKTFHDLLPFAWDKRERRREVSEEEIEETLRMINEENNRE